MGDDNQEAVAGEHNAYDQLMDAVMRFDTARVEALLIEGNANVNCVCKVREGDHQPDTPLRLVMFRLSDNGLTDANLREFGKIARLLLAAGADPEPAMQIAEARYGKYDPDGVGEFMNVWHIVARKSHKSIKQYRIEFRKQLRKQAGDDSVLYAPPAFVGAHKFRFGSLQAVFSTNSYVDNEKHPSLGCSVCIYRVHAVFDMDNVQVVCKYAVTDVLHSTEGDEGNSVTVSRYHETNIYDFVTEICTAERRKYAVCDVKEIVRTISQKTRIPPKQSVPSWDINTGYVEHVKALVNIQNNELYVVRLSEADF